MNRLRLAVAIALLLGGLRWIGQGTGVVRASGMSGQSIWALIGAGFVVVTAALAWTVRGTVGGGSRPSAQRVPTTRRPPSWPATPT